MSFTAVVLMGGKSSRMGTNKAFLQRGSQNMKDFTQQQLLIAGADNVLFSTAQDDNSNSQTIHDQFLDLGPLGGIYSVLKQTLHDNPNGCYLFTPVDLPFLNANALSQIVDTGIQHKCMCHVDKHPLPLFLHASVELLNVLESTLLAKKDLSIRGFIQQFKHIRLPAENTKDWLNTNTPEQWQAAIKSL